MGDSMPRERQPSPWLRNILLLAALALLIALAFAWPGLREQARISTSYAAQSGCACRFISGRELGSCKADLKVAELGRTTGLVMLSEDTQSHAVKASVPLLASQTATFAPDRGCQLEAWPR
ncbi:hypothetical protein WBP07_16060 [Novosphingobium sp. BL-8A]